MAPENHPASLSLTREPTVMGIEIFGAIAVTAMMLFYALEHRSPYCVLGFAVSCAAAALYGVLIQSWPFATIESVWAIVALRRWLGVRVIDNVG